MAVRANDGAVAAVGDDDGDAPHNNVPTTPSRPTAKLLLLLLLLLVTLLRTISCADMDKATELVFCIICCRITPPILI